MTQRQQEEMNLAKSMQDRCKLGTESTILSNNNNEDDYSDDGTQSGRQSRESAFESEGQSSNTDDSLSENNESSGRSSTLGDVKTLNPHSNLVPEIATAMAWVDLVRTKFLEQLREDENKADGLYEDADLDELAKPLPAPQEQEQSLAFRLISRYLDFRPIMINPKLDTQKADAAVESLRDLLKFRKHYQLNHVLPEQFSKEFFLMNGIFRFGCDKTGLPVIYIRARVHRKWSAKFDDTFRRYVAWQVNMITKSYQGAQVNKAASKSGLEKDGSFGVCFDCFHVTYSCLDMDFLRYLVRLFVHYYPTYCRYALCVDLPWLFRSVWKLVRSWLPEESRDLVQLITSKELTDYIEEDQIPNSMRINDLPASEKSVKGRHQFPKNYDSIRDIDGLGKELGMSTSEIKQFRAHAEKVRKEYEQLGAL